MKWKWWKKQKPPSRAAIEAANELGKLFDRSVNPTPPVLTGMTLERWNTSAYASQQLGEAFKTHPILKDALSVLWGQIPRGYPSRGQMVNGETAAHTLGMVNGYMACLDQFEALLKWTPPQEPLQATYAETLEDQMAGEVK